MNIKQFSKGEAVRFGWETTKSNLGFFISLFLVVFILSIIQGVVTDLFEDQLPILVGVLSVVSLVVSIIVQIGLLKIALQYVDHKKGEFRDLYSHANLFFKYIGASILYMLIVFGGFLLLIVPGIIWSIKFGYYKYLIVDQGLGPVAALKKSAEITNGVKMELFLFGILLALINIAGMIALLLGLFLTVPLTWIASAYVYRKLLEQTEWTDKPQVSSSLASVPAPPPPSSVSVETPTPSNSVIDESSTE